MKIIKLKNVVTEIKHFTEWVQQQVRDDKGRVSGHKDKDRLQDLFNQSTKRKQTSIYSLRDLWDHNKRSNICVIIVLEAEEKNIRLKKCSKK